MQTIFQRLFTDHPNTILSLQTDIRDLEIVRTVKLLTDLLTGLLDPPALGEQIDAHPDAAGLMHVLHADDKMLADVQAATLQQVRPLT